MNKELIILGLIEIVSALTIGIFILALTFKIVQWVGKKYYGIGKYNLAYSIFTATIMISVGLMASSVIQPLISSFRLLDMQHNNFILALRFLGTGVIYISIAYSVAILIGLVSTFLYSKLTPINEFEEIRENNVGVALMISSIIITLTLLTKSGVELLIEAIIPYPAGPPV
ncbi:MAG: DUF350 domain-containing protein [Cytophagales bacterium]|nr:DUF350 domain-containing protein [Cytophagales bacterium]